MQGRNDQGTKCPAQGPPEATAAPRKKSLDCPSFITLMWISWCLSLHYFARVCPIFYRHW